MKRYKYIPFWKLRKQYHSRYERMKKRNKTPMATLVNMVVPTLISFGGVWLFTIAMFSLCGVI